jgi:hypothetical protein
MRLVSSQRLTQLGDPNDDALTCVLILRFWNKAIAGDDDGGKGNMCCLAASTASLSTPAKQ